MSPRRPVLLKDLIPIIGEEDQAVSVTYDAHDPLGPAAVRMSASEAIAAHGKSPVLSVVPRSAEHGGSVYVLSPAVPPGYAANPEPLPVDRGSWRAGDDAWIVRLGGTPVAGRIIGISLPGGDYGKASITFRPSRRSFQEEPDDVYGLPPEALFKDAESAATAAGAS